MVISFAIGTLTGATAAWLCGHRIRILVDDKTVEARRRMARALETAARRVGVGLDATRQREPSLP